MQFSVVAHELSVTLVYQILKVDLLIFYFRWS